MCSASAAVAKQKKTYMVIYHVHMACRHLKRHNQAKNHPKLAKAKILFSIMLKQRSEHCAESPIYSLFMYFLFCTYICTKLNIVLTSRLTGERATKEKYKKLRSSSPWTHYGHIKDPK